MEKSDVNQASTNNAHFPHATQGPNPATRVSYNDPTPTNLNYRDEHPGLSGPGGRLSPTSYVCWGMFTHRC